jgi:cytochrome c-type biogenesis protein
VEQVTVLGALIGGLVSFASPCVLPLIPGYISYVSGLSVEEIASSERRHHVPGAVLWNAFAFILGFSALFTLLGAAATGVGQLLQSYKDLLRPVAGLIVILFGLHMLGWLKLSFLYRFTGVKQVRRRPGFFGSFLLGAAIGVGWIPCIGPVLGAILGLAGAQRTVGQGVFLLAVYSLGLGIPFFLAAVGIQFFMSTFKRVRRHVRTVEVLAGAILVVLGVLLATDRMSLLLEHLPKWDFGGRL